MAKHGVPFKKGNPGGPGRPKMAEHLKAFKKFTRTEMDNVLTKYIQLSVEELKSVLKDTSLPALDHWLAQIVLQGIHGGDDKRLTFMFDRLIGKVKDNIEHTFIKPTIIERLDGSTVELGAEIKEIE